MWTVINPSLVGWTSRQSAKTLEGKRGERGQISK